MTPPPDTKWLRFLPALVASSPTPLAQWLHQHPFTRQDVRWLWHQRLAAYTYHLLTTRNQMGLLPRDARATLEGIGRKIAIHDTLYFHELQGVTALFESEAVDSLLMKGASLALTVYPTPRCRFSSDIDFWVLPRERQAAVAVLQRAGYVEHSDEMRPSAYKIRFGGAHQMVRRGIPTESAIELQWPAIRGEWMRVAAAIDHEGIWSRRVPLRVGSSITSIMAPEDLLIHLAVHAAISHQFSIWLGALLDIHLLITNTPGFDWAAVTDRAGAWQVRTVMWAILDVTQRLYGTLVPATVLQQMQPSATRRALFDRLDPEGWLLYEEGERHMNHRRFLIRLALTDRPLDAARLVRHALFPDEEWVRLRYNTESSRELWRQRLRHPLRVLLRAEV